MSKTLISTLHRVFPRSVEQHTADYLLVPRRVKVWRHHCFRCIRRAPPILPLTTSNAGQAHFDATTPGRDDRTLFYQMLLSDRGWHTISRSPLQTPLADAFQMSTTRPGRKPVWSHSCFTHLGKHFRKFMHGKISNTPQFSTANPQRMKNGSVRADAKFKIPPKQDAKLPGKGCVSVFLRSKTSRITPV